MADQPDAGKMAVVSNWRLVLRHAWSVRLIGLCLVLNSASIVLPLMVVAIPPALIFGYAILTFLVIVAAGAARFIHQDKLRDDDGDQ